MNYRLHRNGQSLGVFSLPELHRRRQTGELDGSEHAWREGMADWEPLDTVLQRGEPAAGPPRPPPLPSHRLHPMVIVALVIGGGLFITFIGFGIYQGVKVARNVMPAVNFINNRASRDGGRTALIAASKPVVWTTNTLTAADIQKRRGDFRRRQWLEGYELRGDHNPASDAEALLFLKTWIARNYGGGDIGTNLLTTAAWSERLANDPNCTDPLVQTVVALNTSVARVKIARLERALQGFENSKHLAYPRLNATVTLATDVADQPQRVRVLDEAALRLLQTALNDGSMQPGDQEEYAEALVTGWGQDFFKRNQAAIVQLTAAPGTPREWLSLVLEGESHITAAWKARGNGYASTVTNLGWLGFSAQLAEARRCLTRAWSLHPDWPLAPKRMITVSLGDSGIAEMRMWFDRTVAGQIDNPQAWSDFRWGLRPRWYGDLDAMLAFGRTAVNTGRFDTDVPSKYLDVVADVESEMSLPAGAHLYGRADIWPQFQTFYEGYTEAAASAGDPDAWRTSYTVVAYLANHYDTARQQLEAMNWKPAPQQTAYWNADLSLMPVEVAARTGDSAGKVSEAELARGRRDFAGAEKIYADLLAAPDTDARTREFARGRSGTLSLEEKLQPGVWVDFLPQSDKDPGWAYAWGKSTRLADGALEAQSVAAGHLFYSRARVGPNFEVKGEIEVVGSSNKSFQAGLVMGMPDGDTRFQAYHWYSFRLLRSASRADEASFGVGWSSQQIRRPADLHDGTNTFEFSLRGDSFSATVNGREIFKNTKVPRTIEAPRDTFLLGVGAYRDTNETVVRYRTLQVRKTR